MTRRQPLEPTADRMARILAGEKACPTCSGDIGRCCRCDALLAPKEQSLVADPVSVFKDDDASPHMWCHHCIEHMAIEARGMR